MSWTIQGQRGRNGSKKNKTNKKKHECVCVGGGGGGGEGGVFRPIAVEYIVSKSDRLKVNEIVVSVTK